MAESQFCIFIINEVWGYGLTGLILLSVLLMTLSLVFLYLYILKKRGKQSDLNISDEDQTTFLKSILDHSATGNAIVDSDGIIRYVNFGFMAHFSKNQLPLVGKSIDQLSQLETLNKSFEEENSTIVEIAGTNNDPYLIKYFTVKDTNQKIIGRFLKMIPNISDDDKSPSIDISHELKTPLHAVLGFTNLLKKDEELTAGQKKLLEKIIYHSNLLNGKIKQFVGSEDEVAEPVSSKIPIKKILVVDDVSINRTLLKLMLKRYGLEVQEASNGEAALKILDNWKADMILMDLSMPVMDGIETVKVIRGNNNNNNGYSSLSSSKIIAVTATQRYSREELIKVGFDDLMNKPFKEEELLSRIGIELSN